MVGRPMALEMKSPASISWESILQNRFGRNLHKDKT
jgi:hypothetical protein